MAWSSGVSPCGRYTCLPGDYAIFFFHNKRDVTDTGQIPTVRAALSHKARASKGGFTITTKVLEEVKANPALPSPSAQADNLILWLGDELLDDPGKHVALDNRAAAAIVGSHSEGAFQMVFLHLFNKGLVETTSSEDGELRLSFNGWDRYEELRHGRVDSRRAFMAMEYSDPMNEVFNTFRVAVEETGFELIRLDDQPKAGLIDNRLRVEIRRSRFLIADLSDENAGAYWEAGFAEGLGRPIIYTCEKSKFEKEKTHFDTNHSHTVRWEWDTLDAACKELKDMIRATLPEEAKLTDD